MASQPGQPQMDATGQPPSGTLPSTAPPPYSETDPELRSPEQQTPQQIFQTAYPPQGQPIRQVWQQAYPMPQACVQMLVPEVIEPPEYPGPPSFMSLALMSTILCCFLNVISLAFGIPAVVLASFSSNAKETNNYPQAKRYGKLSLIMSIINISFTLLVSALIVGLVSGYLCADPYDWGFYVCQRL